MGIRLVRWVLDEAPDDLSMVELVALLALAEWARDTTGVCWPRRAEIARRLRRSERTTDRTLSVLVSRGLVEVVKPAAPGRTPSYRLCQRAPTLGARSDDNVRHFSTQRAPSSGEQRAPSDGAQNPQRNPQEPSNQGEPTDDELSAVVRALHKRTGRSINRDHAALVVKQLVDNRSGVRDRQAYLAGAIARDPDPMRFLPTPSPPRYGREPP